MKRLNFFSCCLLALLVTLFSCNDSDVSNPCLPNEFPLEDLNGKITATYYTSNRIATLTYTFDDSNDNFQMVRSYDTDNRVLQVNFYVNGNIAEDFVRMTHEKSRVKEAFYRSGTEDDDILSYRYYYRDDQDRIFSYSIREADNSFARGDSVVFTYTGNNVTHITVYNRFDDIRDNYEITYDENLSPYHRARFNGDEYLYGIYNLSENNVLSIKYVEGDETTTFSYTYKENGYPLTRQSSLATTAGEFGYTCDPVEEE